MALVSFRSSIFNGTMMPTARVWPASSGILLVVRKIFHLNPSETGTTSLHGSVKPGGIFSAVIALYFEHQDRLVEKALAAPAHSRLWHLSLTRSRCAQSSSMLEAEAAHAHARLAATCISYWAERKADSRPQGRHPTAWTESERHPLRKIRSRSFRGWKDGTAPPA